MSEAAFADVIYMQDKDDYHLWSYNTVSQSFHEIGPIQYHQSSNNTEIPLYTLDLASGPDGMLYGIRTGVGTLHRIDPLTGQAELMGQTVNGVSMTFMPSGRLFIYGAVPGQGASLVEVNPETGAMISAVEVGAPASGDLAYDPVRSTFLLSSPNADSWQAPDTVLEINPETGATENRGSFGTANIWGFDILSDSKTLISCSGGNTMGRQRRTPSLQWVTTSTWNTPFSGCLGAARYLCEKPARFLVNGAERSRSEITCGEPVLIDATPAGVGGNYTWIVQGTRPDGQPFFWETSGQGNPGAFNFNDHPSLQALVPQFEDGRPRTYRVTLKRWCVTLDLVHEKTVEIVMNPRPVSWEVRSNRMAFSETLHALDTGTPGRKTGSFQYDVLQHAVGFDFYRELPISDVGFHPLTYTVNRQNGCTSQRTETVQVVHESVFVPNAFTPNGDAHNETFDVVLADPASIESLEFHIFNRWGGLVFSSTSLTPSWDGTTGGLASPSGVYVYILRTKTKLGVLDERRGQITLIR